ncbi:HAD family hydrolase [Thermodesulfobacterium hydrogeniphilum]|uniref:HAD family hydrolase n=1 Tax=Thermodesulfobacterium hydrogeniphilum TaxID=161156 RepID=UPI000B3244CE|nr:HAD family hydrolase [Thermodesulfobacterium hydrogeniphilum]
MKKIVIKIRENGKILCYLAIEDPLRKDSYEAIQKLKTLGIKTVMITGGQLSDSKFCS